MASLLPNGGNKTICGNIQAKKLLYDIKSTLELEENQIYIVWCVSTLQCPPILKLWDTQGYLWLSYDLTEVKMLI